MDNFSLFFGLLGLALGLLGLFLLAFAIHRAVKRKMRLNGLLLAIFMSLLFSAVGAAFVFLSLFVQTFHRLTYEEPLGVVTATGGGGVIDMRFEEAATGKRYVFELRGDQWMVEGYVLRWKPFLRFLGAGWHYRLTRFSGRWESPDNIRITNYPLAKEPGYWRCLLKWAKEIPLVDAAYGVAAFQYPSEKPYQLYLNDAGLVIKAR